MLRPFRLLLAATAAFSVFGSGAAGALDGDGLFTVPVQRLDHRAVLGGTVVPARQVTASAQIPGRVEFLAGTEGDTFPEGTVLIALDDDELLAQRRAALAQMANADAVLRNAGVQYNRELINPGSERPMPGMGFPSMFDSFFSRGMSNMMGLQNPAVDRQADIVARETGIHQARSSFLQAQSQLDEIDAKLRDAVARAPFDGVITQKLVEVGDTVQPGQPLLRFADTEFLQLEVEVPTRLMPSLAEGVIVPVRLDVHNTLVNARVAQVYPMADPNRHTVKVKFDLPNSAPAAPGMYAEVMVVDSTQAAQVLPVVPLSALVRRGSLPGVFVVTPEGRTELRLVRIGDRVGSDRVAVLSGLEPGVRVVIDPAPGMVSDSARQR